MAQLSYLTIIRPAIAQLSHAATFVDFNDFYASFLVNAVLSNLAQMFSWIKEEPIRFSSSLKTISVEH